MQDLRPQGVPREGGRRVNFEKEQCTSVNVCRARAVLLHPAKHRVKRVSRPRLWPRTNEEFERDSEGIRRNSELKKGIGLFGDVRGHSIDGTW